MSDVVNAELLKLATDGAAEEYWHACADPALKASKLAAFVKSRLQAEAPEDARKDEIEIAKHILGLIFPKANDADFAMFVERHGVHIAAIIRADRNAARTSQAEAQAPTTAALTEDDLAAALDEEAFDPASKIVLRESRKAVAHEIAAKVLAFLQSRGLTVVAPAPATTHARQCGYWLDLNCSCKLEARQWGRQQNVTKAYPEPAAGQIPLVSTLVKTGEGL